MAAIGLVRADVGRTILYSLLAGLPTALIAGPLLSRWLAGSDPVLPVAELEAVVEEQPSDSVPGLLTSLVAMLLPVVLMLGPFLAEVCGVARGHPVRLAADWVGTPWLAMLLAGLFGYWALGLRCGHNLATLWSWSRQTLGPSLELLLIIGAGGAFSQVLQAAGAGRALASLGAWGGVSPLVLGWLIAASMRVAVGSATVAVIATAGLMQPVLAAHPAVNRELLVLCMGAGSLVCSHVNDSGFWLIKGYFRLGTGQTLRTWTLVETVIGVAGLVILVAIDRLG
jgi:GntP family gluconate:H+ symporter